MVTKTINELIQYYTPQVEMYRKLWENITNGKVYETGPYLRISSGGLSFSGCRPVLPLFPPDSCAPSRAVINFVYKNRELAFTAVVPLDSCATRRRDIDLPRSEQRRTYRADIKFSMRADWVNRMINANDRKTELPLVENSKSSEVFIRLVRLNLGVVTRKSVKRVYAYAGGAIESSSRYKHCHS